MKLSEQLTEMAEWWILPEELHRTKDSERIHHPISYMSSTFPEYTTAKSSNETDSYLCLLEAEFQKDIESEIMPEQAERLGPFKRFNNRPCGV